MDKLKNDDRFKDALTNPKYFKANKKDTKVKLGKRFERILTDKDFTLKYSVDSKGRPLKQSANEDLKKYYKCSDSEDEIEQIQNKEEIKEKSPNDDDEDDESDEEEKSDEESSSSSDDDDDDSKSISEDTNIYDIVHTWGEMDHDTTTTEHTTPRLAICNMDWDRIKAVDLFILLHSFKPAHGSILSVSIYPSEFGLERMKQEEMYGPLELKADKKEDEKHYNERMRRYQLNRLKYYYAVMVCDTSDTADSIYNNCNNIEYEASATVMDLRFIPEDMEFEHPPSDTSTCLPPPDHYKPSPFVTSALHQCKVNLTWDETPLERTRVLNRDLKKVSEDDDLFNQFLASASEDDDGASDDDAGSDDDGDSSNDEGDNGGDDNDVGDDNNNGGVCDDAGDDEGLQDDDEVSDDGGVVENSSEDESRSESDDDEDSGSDDNDSGSDDDDVINERDMKLNIKRIKQEKVEDYEGDVSGEVNNGDVEENNDDEEENNDDDEEKEGDDDKKAGDDDDEEDDDEDGGDDEKESKHYMDERKNVKMSNSAENKGIKNKDSMKEMNEKKRDGEKSKNEGKKMKRRKEGEKKMDGVKKRKEGEKKKRQRGDDDMEEQVLKYRALLKEITEKEEICDDDDDDVDMEVTWKTGTMQAAEGMLEEKKKKEMTSFDKYHEKRKMKRNLKKAKKLEKKTNPDKSSKSEFKSKTELNESLKSDLELLMMDKTNLFTSDNNNDEDDKKDTKKMSMRQRMMKKKKMKQEKKGLHSVTTPVTDSRFTKMYTHEDFFLQQQTT